MDGWMKGWMDDKRIDEWMKRLKDGWMDGFMTVDTLKKEG